MNRAVFWTLFGALALSILAAAWFVGHYERVPTTRWEKPGKEALRNPYLALERFTARMGRPLARIGNALSLDELPPGGALLLDRARRIHLNPQRADAVLRWVAQGGYLIVAAEPEAVDDPILKRLGVAWYRLTGPASDKAGAADDHPSPVDALPIALPGAGTPLYLKTGHWEGKPGLLPSAPVPVWRAEPGRRDTGAVLLHYAHGRGQITVLGDFTFLTNWNIGEYDDAELIWALLERYAPRGPLRLAARLEVPSLWAWLADSAWMALVSAGLLIVAWLWAIVPRFGGVLPASEPERRGLSGHLAAMGRAVWREGGLAHWAGVLRQDLRETIQRRHPHIPALPEAGRIEALSRIGGISPERVVSAVVGPEDAVNPDSYTELARVAQRLGQRP